MIGTDGEVGVVKAKKAYQGGRLERLGMRGRPSDNRDGTGEEQKDTNKIDIVFCSVHAKSIEETQDNRDYACQNESHREQPKNIENIKVR